MTNTLLVPIHLDALYLPKDTSVLEEMTDYSKLPYFNEEREKENRGSAYLSETVLSPPFEQANLTLKAGIHLHWALPDALTNGIAREGEEGITFPLVPNRWLIMRRGGKKSEKQWIVESDYLYAESEKPQDAINILYHPGSGEYQPYRFLGRKLELEQWRSGATNAQYVEELTAIGPFATVDSLDNEKAAFAGFYPNCRSVFGFHDADFKTTTPPDDLLYDVIGWYSDGTKDYLAKFIKEQYQDSNSQNLLELLQEKAGWTLELANNQGFPNRILCHASLKFKPGGSLTDPKATLPNPTIAVGNTQEEAIATYLAHKLDNKIENRKILEEQLEALQMSERLEQQKLDFGPKFRESLQENGFTGHTKEILWQVVPESNSTVSASGNALPANAVEGEGQMQVTLPTSIGDLLNTANVLQHEYDRKLAEIGSIREQVYADWYKYMRSFYVNDPNNQQKLQYKPEAEAFQETSDSDLIKILIELPAVPLPGGSCNQYGLPALEDEIKSAGILGLIRDERGEIASASAVNSESDSIATRLAQSINTLIANIERFNQESRLIPPKNSQITVTGNCTSVADDVAGKCLYFNGTQNYFKVSGLQNIRSISMWVKIPDGVRGSLLDARNDLANSGFAADEIGSNWEKMYVNGEVKPLNWRDIPKNQWVFLYLQAKSSFSGTIHLMSNLNRTKNLLGNIASVYFHQQPLSPDKQPLSPAEIQQSYQDKIGLLRPSYILKIVPGPRYWQQGDPVILMTGDAVKPTRDREDERFREDDLLQCQLLSERINWQEFPKNTLTTLTTILNQFANQPREKIGFHEWTNQPWNPFLLEWSVQFFTLRHNTDRNIQNTLNIYNTTNSEQDENKQELIGAAVPNNYDPNILKNNYQLPVNGVELSPTGTGGGNYYGTSNSYSGACFLSPSAGTLLKENLLDYLKKYLLPAYYEAQKTPSEQQTEDFLSHNFNAVKSWYQPKKPSVDDPIYTALGAYEQLQSLNCLAQSIGGFNDALLTYKRTMQLGVNDSLVSRSEDTSEDAFEDTFEDPFEDAFEDPFEDPSEASFEASFEAPLDKGFLSSVQTAVNKAGCVVPDSILRSPSYLNDFNPIRAGVLRITDLRIVDTFGRIKVVVDSTNLTQTEIVTSQTLTLPLTLTPPRNCEHPIYLPPRLAQPARLNLRWLSATQGQQEMNDSPTTTPICGWILPNNLDNSLTIYDNQGSPLGILDRRAKWQAIPGSNPAIAIESIANQDLRQMVRYLIEQKEGFFTDFLTTVNQALETIDPEGFAQNQAISLLVARPLALVRAKVNLELQGLPAISQNITAFSADIFANKKRTTDVFEKIKFPIRIGEYQQFNDSLVGYWVEKADDPDNRRNVTYKDDIFYAPQSCYVSHKKIKTLFDNPTDPTPDTPVNLEQTLEANSAQTLVMLIDPRGQINASCGVLPAKRISLPPEQYVPALQSIAVTFLSAPLLSDLNKINDLDQIKLSLPEVPGYVWSWLGKDGNDWSTRPLHAFDSQSIFSSPQKIYDGWLKLSKKTTDS